MFYHYFKSVIIFLSEISWPIIVLVIFIFLRKPISSFLTKLKGVSVGNVTLDAQNLQIEAEKVALKNDGNSSEVDFSILITSLSQSTNEELNRIMALEVNVHPSELQTDTEKKLYNYSKLLIVTRHFEKIYNIIYGSQIAILRILSKEDNTKKNLKYLYDNSVMLNPDFFVNYNYVGYLNFLISFKLVSDDKINDKLILTDLGRDFLLYLDTYNLNTDLPN